MNKFHRVLLTLIAAAAAQNATAQTAQPPARPPVRVAGAVPYAFPGQWVFLGDAMGETDNIIAIYYDAARVRRAGNIVSTVELRIDEKNADGIRTNLFEDEIDCSTNRARPVRVQNYDAAHYPLVTPAPTVRDWDPIPQGGSQAAIKNIVCGGGAPAGTTIANVQAAALQHFGARRAQANDNFAVRWGPYATLAQQGWWRRTDGHYWHYSWITPGQELRAEYFTADGKRAWNLTYRIENGMLLSNQFAPQPIHTLTPTSIAHGQYDSKILSDGGRRLTTRSGNEEHVYIAAPAPSFAQGANPGSGSGQPTSILDAQRQFAAAVDGAAYPIGEGNPPGQWRTLDTSTECMSRFRLMLPARTSNGTYWAASSHDYDFPWSRILSAESVAGSDYVRLPTAAYAQFGVQVRPGQQSVAVGAARYLISRCASRAAPAAAPAPAGSPSGQAAPAERSLLLHWEDEGQWRPNRVWQPWDAMDVSATLRTRSGPSRGEITFDVEICNTSGKVWKGTAAFYEDRELTPTTLNLQPGGCGTVQRTRANGRYQLYLSLKKQG